MAEASVAGTSARYYCHVCNEDISPVLPEYTCPGCRGGFIEQREVERVVADDPDDELPPTDDTYMRAVMQMLNFGPVQAPGSGRPILIRGATRAGQRTVQVGGQQPPHLHHQHQHGFLGDILDNLFANFPNVRVNVNTGGEGPMGVEIGSDGPIQFRLHGNPGDYAWGNIELDRIVTQLLNQLDTSGPPPLNAQLIERLPTVAVTQESVDANMQCMVCFEDYVLNEKVRQLPCSHLFHSGCIVPWLELHGTCPICRSSVDLSRATPPPGQEPQPPPSGSQSSE